MPRIGLNLCPVFVDHYKLVYLDLTASTFDARLESALVVLIDEYTIEKYKLSYPVDYGSISRILRAISGYDPDAVFIDILQSYQHSKGLNKWLDALNNAGEKHPVYLAQDLDFDIEQRLNNKGNIRHKLNEVATLTPVSWKGPSNRYPLTINHDGQKHKTTAMAMYKEFCKTSDCQLFKSSEGYDEPMVVRWSNKVSSKQLEFTGVADGCESSERGMWQAFQKHVTYGFKSKEDIAELSFFCPPILTLSAAEFFAPNGTDDETLREVIKNRSVFIGYRLTGSSDLFSSPVHGQLPGVFYHAMAFVNLVSLDENYWRSQNAIDYCPIVESCNFSKFDLIQTLLQTIVLGFSIYLKSSQNLNGREDRTLSIGSSIYFALLLIIVFVLVLIFQSSGGPANWIALLGILIISTSILVKPLLIKYLQWAASFLKTRLLSGNK